MVCVYCGGETKVTNSRHQKRPNSVWRRRQCVACNTVFTSIEKADLTGSIVVTKPKRPVQPFSRDKLLLSIYDSLRHRKTALEDARAISETVISRLLGHASVESIQIAEITYSVLLRFDRAAATYYKAFHPFK